MERFIEVANVKEINPGQARLIHFGYQSIAIFNVGGAFYVTDEFCTGDGGFVEIQGTAEKTPFSDEQLTSMIALARNGVTRLIQLQKGAVA